MRGWRAGRRRVALLVVAALGLACGSGPPAPGADLRVMSLNLRYAGAPDGEDAWEKRRDFLLDTVRRFGPALLGTQECLAEQADFLRRGLEGYELVGVGRDDGRLAGEMCAVLYRADRFRRLAEGHFWLSETPAVAGSKGWDAALPRMATWVRLELVESPGTTVCFVNTHFDHVGAVARLRSARLLRATLPAVCGPSPVIVTGDFNGPAEATSEGPYRALTGEPEGPGPVLLDAFRAVHPPGAGEGTFHGFTGRTDGPRIDWVLVSAGVDPLAAGVLRTERDGRYPSDHFPVTAAVRLRPARLRDRGGSRRTGNRRPGRGRGRPPRATAPGPPRSRRAWR